MTVFIQFFLLHIFFKILNSEFHVVTNYQIGLLQYFFFSSSFQLFSEFLYRQFIFRNWRRLFFFLILDLFFWFLVLFENRYSRLNFDFLSFIQFHFFYFFLHSFLPKICYFFLIFIRLDLLFIWFFFRLSAIAFLLHAVSYHQRCQTSAQFVLYPQFQLYFRFGRNLIWAQAIFLLSFSFIFLRL